IIAPFYDCTQSQDPMQAPPTACDVPKGPGGVAMTDGLSVIDLADNTVYIYENDFGGDGGGMTPTGNIIDPNAPVGVEPDSAAIDPTTGVAVVPSEGSGYQNVIDFSQAHFDKSTKTVTAPLRIIDSFDLTGVAIEYNKHLGFWEEEHTSDVAVADLTQANAGGTAWVHGQIPSVPGGSGFGNLGDPHGIAVTTSLTSSGPVGFVVDSQLRWIARVDLAKMLANAQGSASTDLDETQTAPYVTFLDGATKE
ncbi:MAG: hypothetical protein JOZ69_10365, partial [Myxococcales bacterium]|nr:hypothetical protein [Myxococcales bacterium]